SLVNALLLTDLPYPHPESIGAIYARTAGSESSSGRISIDGEQWDLLRDEAPSLISAVSTLRTSGLNLQGGAHARYLQAARVSAQYFEVLGIRPLLGRSFSAHEDRQHGPRAAILSNVLWRTVFGADANILGQSVRLKGEPYTVVGVLPASASTPL